MPTISVQTYVITSILIDLSILSMRKRELYQLISKFSINRRENRTTQTNLISRNSNFIPVDPLRKPFLHNAKYILLKPPQSKIEDTVD